MTGLAILTGFIIGGIVIGGIAQAMTNVKSVSSELGVLAWSFVGGVVGIILTDLILQQF